MAYASPSLTASGTTWAQLQAGGVSGQLEKLITAQAATLAPTVTGTATATGGGASGGLLAASTYYLVVTESNGIGESTIGPESAQLTVGATNIPRYTFQTLKTGNTARNLYIGAAGGASGGPYTLYADGITTSTYDLAIAVPGGSYAVAPPTVNSTGLSTQKLSMLRAAKTGNLENDYRFLRQLVDEFLRGEPISFNDVIGKLRDAHVTFLALATVCAEIGVLIDANPGTLAATVVNPLVGGRVKRTWP